MANQDIKTRPPRPLPSADADGSAAGSRQRRGGSLIQRREGRMGYLLIAPTTALLTVFYLWPVVPATMAIGLIIAALLSQPFRGRAVYRALLFVPYIAPIVGSALIFTYILSPLGGIVNGLLTSWGVAPVGFLTTEPWALVSVIVFSIWQGTGYAMIIYTAALSGIPRATTKRLASTARAPGDDSSRSRYRSWRRRPDSSRSPGSSPPCRCSPRSTC